MPNTVVTSVGPKSLKSCFQPPEISMSDASVIGSLYDPPATRTMPMPLATALVCASEMVEHGLARGPHAAPVLPVVVT